jgi:hypothetical protein
MALFLLEQLLEQNTVLEECGLGLTVQKTIAFQTFSPLARYCGLLSLSCGKSERTMNNL